MPRAHLLQRLNGTGPRTTTAAPWREVLAKGSSQPIQGRYWVISQYLPQGQSAAEAVGITVMNEDEILHGLARLPVGRRRRQALEERWEQLVRSLFSGRVFPFDRPAAHWYAALLQQRDRIGQPFSTADAVIAAIALAHGATLATRHTADFEGIGLPLINPWPAA
jgi:predicted nucleic acid-binding protein